MTEKAEKEKIAKVVVNNEKVKAVKVAKEEKKDILGSKLFSEIYANVFICSRKKSGKTTVIYKILQKCANRNTTVIAFVSTVEKDSTWKAIEEMLEKKGIPFVAYKSMVNDEGGDLLRAWLEIHKDDIADKDEETGEEKKDEAEEEVNDLVSLAFDDDRTKEDEEKEEPKHVYKSKYLSPEYIFIFDDLGDEIVNSRALTSLLKWNRHFKCKVICSSQWVKDLKPACLKQMDYWLVFAGQDKEKLMKIYKDADLNIGFETFQRIYEDATKDKYCFLYIDVNNCKFRKCFDKEYVFS